MYKYLNHKPGDEIVEDTPEEIISRLEKELLEWKVKAYEAGIDLGLLEMKLEKPAPINAIVLQGLCEEHIIAILDEDVSKQHNTANSLDTYFLRLRGFYKEPVSNK